MQFAVEPPNEAVSALMGDFRWQIYASGEIDADAGKRLDALIQARKIIDGSLMVIDSPGGNLLGGIELGRTIRKHNLTIQVGQKREKVQPGFCVSACALAFLGGRYRYLGNGSVYGVHRFFFDKPMPNESDLTQVLSAAVVAYIKEMGVSTELFSIATRAGRDRAVTLAEPELLRLGVINNGRGSVAWTIESFEGGIYLKGQRETVNGINKLLIVCPSDGKPFLHFIFDAGVQGDVIMRMSADSLVVDGQYIPIENYRIERKIINGWVNAMYGVDGNLMTRIATAKNVGLALQGTRSAPVFAGFEDLPMSEGAAKLPGLLSVCVKPNAH
jgi:hypothetical protein